MIDLVKAILCLRKFLWKFRHSLNCTTRVVPILQAVLHRMVDGFVKQRGRYHHHPVSILCGWFKSRMAECTSFPQRSLSPSSHLVRFAASSTSNPILFTFYSTCLLHICFGLPRFRCPYTSSINAFFRTLS